MISISIDVDLDDIYDQLDRYDKKELAEWLQDDGLIGEAMQLHDPDQPRSLLDHEWSVMMTKISMARYQLTPDQEAQLIELAESL
jgi:hypothetical protein